MIDPELLSRGYLALACPQCHYLTYVKPDNPKVCDACKVELKTTEECEAIWVAEHQSK